MPASACQSSVRLQAPIDLLNSSWWIGDQVQIRKSVQKYVQAVNALSKNICPHVGKSDESWPMLGAKAGID